MSWKNRLSKRLFGQYGTTRTLTDKRKPHHVSRHRPVRVAEGLHHPWGSAFLDLGEEHFACRHELFVGERDSGSGCCGCRCTVAVEEDVSQHSRDLFDGPAFAAFMKSTARVQGSAWEWGIRVEDRQCNTAKHWKCQNVIT